MQPVAEQAACYSSVGKAARLFDSLKAGLTMIENVVSVGLFVGEKLNIQKNRIAPAELTGREKRLCVVTGVHGDELDGQYVCYELTRRLNLDRQHLRGIVDIYPALNPLGIDSVTRGIPMFDLDMNRIFPGTDDGAVPEYIASKIVADIAGADMCLDIHSSNSFLRDIPQVRVSDDNAPTLLPLAKLLNVELIWAHPSATVLQSTLAHSLNSIGVPTLAVVMGVGMRITRTYGDRLVDGILRLMAELGLWDGDVPACGEPVVSTDGQVTVVSARTAGTFLPCVEHNLRIEAGGHIGDIVNPLSGAVEERITAPCGGVIFTLREYPIVYKGSLLARILGGVEA